MFHLAYTEDIMAETIHSMRRSNPGMPGRAIAAARDNMLKVLDLRITDYPSGQDATQITDRFDRHVHAAAISGGVDCIITNDHGFTKMPLADRDELEDEIYTPDEFLVLIDDASPSLVRTTTKMQIDHFAKPKHPSYDLPGALVASGCPNFADRVKSRCREIAVSCQ